MEARQKHTRQTTQVISDRILGHSCQMAKSHLSNRGPVWAVLTESFAQVETQCADVWMKVADQVPGILIWHVPAGQVGMFLATLYQLMCTQQQGIAAMVVTHARVPVHLGIHNWATQVALIRLFAQVILGLGSLTHACPVVQPISIWDVLQLAQAAPQTLPSTSPYHRMGV